MCNSDFGNLEPYQQAICGNFEIPVHVGRLIAQWDHPEFIDAVPADHMRESDYVVGLVHRGVAAAFPLWITDYYHVVNCELAGDPVMFTTCERCQSGSAFLAVLDGKPARFSATGMYNASLTLTSRSGVLDRQGSLWLHYEGVCIQGEHRGEFLPQIPAFHMTWGQWKELHPDTIVMTVPEACHHEDARHGHGREEFFSRPGMDPPLIQTITGELDGRYPENEMVLGINAAEMLKAWPLREVQKSGGAVHDRMGKAPIVVFAGPAADQVTMASYCREVNGQALTFERRDRAFVDHETRSLWNIEGAAVDGPLAGERLPPLRWQYVRWHAWFYPHRQTELYRCQEFLPVWPQVRRDLDERPFADVLDRLSRLRRTVVVEHAVPQLCLPHEATEGLVLRVGDDRLNLYLFQTFNSAQDYVDLEGAWFCHPIAVKLGRKFSRRMGRFVLESDPEVQYEGPSQFVRLPDPQIPWSDLVIDNEVFGRLIAGKSELPLSDEQTFFGLVSHLRKQGFDVVEVAFLPHSQLRVGTDSAIAATINADRFGIYKCRDDEAARRVAGEFSHNLRVGRWVIRSTPAIMFQDPCYEMGQLPEAEARWSKLVENGRFAGTLTSYLSTETNEQSHAA